MLSLQSRTFANFFSTFEFSQLGQIILNTYTVIFSYLVPTLYTFSCIDQYHSRSLASQLQNVGGSGGGGDGGGGGGGVCYCVVLYCTMSHTGLQYI